MKRIITLMSFCLFAGMVLNGQASLKVSAIGNVGIHEDNPQALLHVASGGSSTTMYAGYNQAGVQLFGVKEGGTGNGNFFVQNNTGVRTIQFASGGQFYVNTGSNFSVGRNTGNGNTFDVIGTAGKSTGEMWTNTSDKRSKKNIETYSSGINELMKLNPITFQYNGKYGTPNDGVTRVGVIAQEIQKVAPRTVTIQKRNTATLEESESPSYKASEHEEEFLAVNASEVLWMLVNASKEQQVMIEELMSENEALRTELANIHKQIESHDNSAILNGTGAIGSLEQNVPNPFNGETKISYFIPEGSTKAALQITSPDGKLLKTVDLNQIGQGSLDLTTVDMAGGNYYYTLTIDGKIVETKKMIIAR